MHNERSNLFQVHGQWLRCNAIHSAYSVTTLLIYEHKISNTWTALRRGLIHQEYIKNIIFYIPDTY